VKVLVLGCGYTGLEVARIARDRGHAVTVTARSSARAQALRDLGFEVSERPSLDSVELEGRADSDTHVVVCFPPDGQTCARIAPSLARAGSVAVISTTGVYCATRGRIDERTPPPEPDTENTRRQLASERAFLEVGASIVRAAGIYGPDRGLHLRILRGQHKIPGDGSRFTSRIHVHDLAQVLLACANRKGLVFPLGDARPCTQLAIATYLATAYGVPLPPFAPIESVHHTFQGDRQIDASRTLALLGVQLTYPSYESGMAPSVTGIAANAL